MREMKATHTLGPWSIFDDPERSAVEIQAPNAAKSQIALVSKWRLSGPSSQDEAAANVHLIAAAPDLLEVAKHFEACIEFEMAASRREGDDEGVRLKTISLNLTRAAIAKATGA